MACISHHKIKGYRVHWRFTVKAGPRAGEAVRGSLLLGRCSKAAAKAHLRKVEAWEASVKTGEQIADAAWKVVREAWLRERELVYTEQTLARAKRVIGTHERWGLRPQPLAPRPRWFEIILANLTFPARSPRI